MPIRKIGKLLREGLLSNRMHLKYRTTYLEIYDNSIIPRNIIFMVDELLTAGIIQYMKYQN